MADSKVRSRVWLPSSGAIRLAAVAVIVFGPIASAAWTVHGPERGRPGYVEIDPAAASGSDAERIRAYLARRNPALDRLLPNGAGGTRFFEDLDGNAGMAFPHLSLVAISATAGDGGWPGAVELHERAHLLHAFLPEEVAGLLVRLAAPSPGEYAATNDREHFAEMAAKAWEIVSPPESMCVDGTPAERLRDAETRVPGTAAFVMWYLRNLRDESVGSDEDLARTAEAFSARYGAESNAVWTAVDERRLPDGGLRPWGYRTPREYLEGMRAGARASRHLVDRIAGHLLLPSLTVLSIAGR